MNQTTIGNFAAKNAGKKSDTGSIGGTTGSFRQNNFKTGNCMPDYSVIESLCKELGISIAELMDGEEAADNSIRTYDDSQILDLIQRTQVLEHQRTSLYGLILIIMGMALLFLHYNVSGSNVKDFFSGIFLGLSIAEMLVGVYVVARGLSEQK